MLIHTFPEKKLKENREKRREKREEIGPESKNQKLD